MMDRVEHVKASYAALERMMGLRDNQKAAWAAYTGARVKAAEERREAWAKNKTPALDQQTILERRVERLKSELKNLESVTEKRAALMKVLDASQNVALDQYESHRGMRKHGMRKGPGMGPRGFGPKGPGPQGKAPGPQGDPAPKDGGRPL
jgi:hypothetical protein